MSANLLRSLGPALESWLRPSRPILGGRATRCAFAPGQNGGTCVMNAICVFSTFTFWLQSKDGAWQSKAATEWRTLRQVQGELETEKGQAEFLGTSLADTVCKCIHLGDRRSANKLRDKFHISERRFAWLVVRSLALCDSYVPQKHYNTAGKAHVKSTAGSHRASRCLRLHAWVCAGKD